MADAVLKISGLDAHYDLFQALYGVEMQVSEGEVIAIIGANGAGKTTLMRSISGLLSNANDQIVYRGTPIGALAPHKVAEIGIALVPEGRQLFPSLSVEENLIIGGRIGRKRTPAATATPNSSRRRQPRPSQTRHRFDLTDSLFETEGI